jgi:hypothetical protein
MERQPAPPDAEFKRPQKSDASSQDETCKNCKHWVEQPAAISAQNLTAPRLGHCYLLPPQMHFCGMVQQNRGMAPAPAWGATRPQTVESDFCGQFDSGDDDDDDESSDDLR